MHETASTPARCIICGYDRRGLPRFAACPECGAFDEPRDPPTLWAQAVGFTWLAIVLAILDSVFAVTILVLNLRRPKGADEFATTVPVSCWLYAVLPIASIAILLTFASLMFTRIRMDGTFARTLTIAIAAATGPLVLFFIFFLILVELG